MFEAIAAPNCCVPIRIYQDDAPSVKFGGVALLHRLRSSSSNAMSRAISELKGKSGTREPADRRARRGQKKNPQG
jgi:hypothetical protein